MMIRFQQFQVDVLELAFQESDHLTRERKIELAIQTGLDVEQVTSWFNRRRAREREREARRTSEQRIAELQQALLHLQQELEESRRREIGLRAEIQRLRQQQLGTTHVVVDSDIDPILRFVNEYA